VNFRQDRWTDIIAIASTHLALRAVARKNDDNVDDVDYPTAADELK